MRVILMLGGNLGDSAEIFRESCRKLNENGLKNIQMSDIFRSAAEDCVPGTPDFSDAALAGDWDGTPHELLKLTQKLEREAGRPAKHSSRESRTLDIDIILFGNEIINTPDLIIPHPRAAKRQFVLEPICQIAPNAIFPDSNLPLTFFSAGKESKQRKGR